MLNETYTPRTDEGRAAVQRLRVRIARKLGMRVDDVFTPLEEAVA